jgi:hypothetical protein
MRIVITEEQFNRFNRSSPALQNGINKYLNQYIKDGTRKIGKKSRNYGNLSEDWCIDGKNTISVYYNFDVDGNFKDRYLYLDRELVKTISRLFSVKPTYVFHVIEEWYQDIMIPKFEQIVGESGLYVDKIDTSESTDDCVPEPEKPEGITDDEMIDFIVKNTLYSKPEVLQKIESGERDLEDFYLDIVDVVNRRK